MVITIGREFGSGGKYIGEKLAEELGIKIYDKDCDHCWNFDDCHQQRFSVHPFYPLDKDDYRCNF